jgi:hypothetical protein
MTYLNIQRRNFVDRQSHFDRIIAIDDYDFSGEDIDIGDAILLDLDAQSQKILDSLDMPEKLFGIRRFNANLSPEIGNRAFIVQFELRVAKRTHHLVRQWDADDGLATMTKTTTITIEAITDEVEQVLVRLLRALEEVEGLFDSDL